MLEFHESPANKMRNEEEFDLETFLQAVSLRHENIHNSLPKHAIEIATKQLTNALITKYKTALRIINSQ